jgi:peroxiredoxin family protein
MGEITNNRIHALAPDAPDAMTAQIKELEGRIATLESKGDKLTMVLFSGDFDKAMAAFIIANGAIAMGREVTIFVTFWGLDAIKKASFDTSGRGFFEKMVLMMRPKGAGRLGTSQMNFGGIGPKLFKFMMKQHNVEKLESLIKMAMEFGVKIVACQMSVDLMGIKGSDLLDGVEFGGVAAFLGDAYDGQVTLFI